MLLDDGAHFSLLTPRLQSLRAADRGGQGADRLAVGAAADQPLPGRALGRARGARRRHRAGAGVAAPGRRAARARRGRRARPAGDAGGGAAPLPARRVRLAGVAVGARARRDPRRRHGTRQDAAGARADLPRARGATRASARSWSSRRRASCRTGSARRRGSRPGSKVEAVTDTLARSGRTIDEVAAADVVVTTYTLLRLEAEDYRTVAWAGLILDEAQYVKNHQAKTYRCVRELAAPFKLAITGTPMENNLMELWSLLSITAPGLFPDPKRFAEQYARPIERGGGAEQLARLRRRIKPLVKRRTKELVAADLPAKQEQTLEVDLHPRHRKLYDTYLQRERQKILGLIDDFDRNRFTILRSITLLRQLSLHPGLVDDRARRRALRQARRASRAAGRRHRRRPPGARLQPVHGLPGQGPRAPRPRGHRLLLPRRAHPPARSRARALQGRTQTRCS